MAASSPIQAHIGTVPWSSAPPISVSVRRFLALKQSGATAAASASVRLLLEDGRAAVTLLLWTMFFMNLLNLWFLNNWLPLIMTDAGIRIEVIGATRRQVLDIVRPGGEQS